MLKHIVHRMSPLKISDFLEKIIIKQTECLCDDAKRCLGLKSTDDIPSDCYTTLTEHFPLNEFTKKHRNTNKCVRFLINI